MAFDLAALANLALALSLVVAIIFGVLQVLAASRDRKERLTIEVLRAFQTREFAQHMMGLRDHPPPTTAKKWLEMPEKTRTMYLHFSQEMEMLGLLVFDRKLDIDLVERTLGNFAVTSWEAMRPSIEDLRVETKDPYLNEYFQWLAENVQARMRDQPRAPAYTTRRSNP